MSDLSMRRGDTKPWTLSFARNGAPIDLTGATIWFTAKQDYKDLDSAAVFQKKTSGGGIVVALPLTGVAVVTIVPLDTAKLPGETVNLHWDVQVLEASGTISTPDDGTLVVSPDVTQSTS